MYTSELKEKYQNEQRLESTFTKKAFKELIRYIYVGEVRKLNKHAFELHASDYYQIESLKSIREEELHKSLSDNNASHIFQYAHLYQCSDSLKTAAFAKVKRIFAAKNYTIPQSFIDDPSKVEKFFELKNSLEYELRPQEVTENKDDSFHNTSAGMNQTSDSNFWTKLSKKQKKIYESPRVIDRGTSAHFCVSDQYLITKVLRIK